ncbi:hypothetical protein Tco_0232396 [Tanacetum coccineum]
MPTEMELTLEQTQQGVSYEVDETRSIHMLSETLSVVKHLKQSMDPVTLCTQPLPATQSRKDVGFKLTEKPLISIDFLTPSYFDIEKWHSAPASD